MMTVGLPHPSCCSSAERRGPSAETAGMSREFIGCGFLHNDEAPSGQIPLDLGMVRPRYRVRGSGFVNFSASCRESGNQQAAEEGYRRRCELQKASHDARIHFSGACQAAGVQGEARQPREGNVSLRDPAAAGMVERYEAIQ